MDAEIAKKVGNILRHEREARGWSQKRVAEAVGTNADTVSKWERGINIPDPYFREKLMHLFGKSAKDLGFIDDQTVSTTSHISAPLPISSAPSGEQENSSMSSPNRATLITHSGSPSLISVPKGAMVFVVHNGVTTQVQIPSSSQVDIQKSNIAYAIEAESLPVSSETLMTHDTESNYIMNRREAGKKIASIGATLLMAPNLLGLMQVGTMLHDEEILSVCAVYIPICWRLFFDGQLSEVQRVLPNYISQLAIPVRLPSIYQRQAASLASKAHQLACMVALQEQDYGTALIHVDQALLAAGIAEDANLQVASLVRKALAYRYLKRFEPMLEAYQEASQYSKSVSPLLQGRLYTGLAEAHSKFEQEYEAKHFLELAYKTFPENPKDDPNFSYTHFKFPQLFEGFMYLNLKQPNKAWDALAQVDKSVPTAIVPDRVELSIEQARASLLFGDMKQSCKYLESAATSALALGSDLRYNETRRIYGQMQMKWPREQQVKALAGHFQ